MDILKKLGLTHTIVRDQIAATAPLKPEEVRRALARMVPKGSSGRRGLPAHVLEAMYADYKKLNSLREVGKLYGRSRQVMWEIFTTNGFELNERIFHDKIIFKGRSYTLRADGYYRCTTGTREGLHHAMWKARNGAIPPGHQITFLNGNASDFSPENLACMPKKDVGLFHQMRRDQQKS